MAAMNADHVTDVIEFLKENKARGDDVSLNDVMRLAEVMAGSFKDFLHTHSPSMRGELEEIANEIARMKDEIVDLRASDMKNNKIPQAGRELDAIVEATEQATHTIMETAEEIMAADTSDAAAYQSMVSDKMISIFEACTFQDITGQRIAKVVSTLAFIDEKVTSFVARLKIMEADEGVAEETEEERRQRELILHGPQAVGEGVSQDDIDSMMSGDGSSDATGASDQGDIDKMFG